MALIDAPPTEVPLTAQADLLGVSRSSLYYRPIPASPKEVHIKHRIDAIYTQYPFYGSRRIAALIQLEEVKTSRTTVQRYMQEMGIAAIHPRPNLSRRHAEHQVYPYLLRHTTSQYTNHIWGIDITYIRLRGGWMYLVAILDWYSRYIVAWELDDSLELPFVLAAVDRALEQARPVIWNSDQGSHFTSPHYTMRLQAANVQISMDGKGRALDNIFVERLWRTVKYENVYLQDYGSPRAARTGLTNYLHFYNEERIHQALGYQTPAAVYFGRAQLATMS
ncbi:MAG: Mobile element protein [uncultured Chloroflexia bacterium]|uniref:Mobile element protein n=1 Tax=uncultured Chloroflexia bacterium TaxID=1672391 RepID=A0A6J4LMU5_9CHLR|nr:MAG: Mobile element protein [uncultured Chloroflexia bacterium]